MPLAHGTICTVSGALMEHVASSVTSVSADFQKRLGYSAH